MSSIDHPDPLSDYLRRHAERALAGLAALPEPAAVHRTRVALRRLRTALRVDAPLIDLTPARQQSIAEDLRWLGRLLGAVRDPQVLRARFATALDALPPEHVLGPVRARIDDTLSVEQAQAERALEEARDSERWRALVELLESWRAAPPVLGTGPGDVRKRARKAAAKAERRLAASCATGADSDLHRARKAAKRARYAAEVLRSTGRGRKQVKRFRTAQAALGEFHDAVAARAALRRIVSGVPAGESGFTLGILHEREHRQVEELRRRACALGEALGEG